MPPRLRLYLWASPILGLATLGVAVLLAGGGGIGPVGQLAAFTAALTWSWAFPLLVLRREETEAFQLDEAFLVALILLQPPLGTLLAFGLASLVGRLAIRRPLHRVLFNTGVALVSTGLALLAAWALHPGDAIGPRSLVAAVVAAAVFLVANGLCIAAVIATVEGRPWLRVFRDGLGFRLLVWAATVAVGLLGGLAGAAHSWALLLAVPPMGVLQLVLAGSLRARQDRQRVDGLLRAALDAHASMDPAGVEEAIAASARELLECREARFSTAPPGPGELGSRLPGPGYPERWLVVSGRRGLDPFGSRDAKLLEAVVTVGVSALENAVLVDQIKHQVFHDALTGLPNQLLFEERVGLALSQTRVSDTKVAVMVVDLDRFKRVNDCLGHPAGNELLRQVAARLAGTVRSDDTVARMGGDEFTLLLSAIRTRSGATVVAEKILAAFRVPFLVHGEELHISPSIGVAIGPDDGSRPSVLLKNADTAMYRAKERGRNGYEVYAQEMAAGARNRLTLERDLHHALDAGQLRVVYQPQIDLESGQVIGVEVLARWPHPTLGMVAPDVFIPLAEETGLIVPLDDWVLRTACTQARAWEEAGLPAFRIAVNLSGRAFQRTRVAERVADTLRHTGLAADRLELEVTESMAVDQGEDTRPVFQELERLGVRLAIDDFGTGYSALSRLQGFPFHTLKIDRSFVCEIQDAGAEAPIVAAMIAMAHAMGLEVVAEGVETEAQHGFLDRHGCDIGQGYLFSRPLDASQVEGLVRLAPALASSRVA